MTEIPAADILKSLPQSIGDVIKPWADRSPDRLALVETSGSWTYRQLNDAVERATAWLQDSGVRPGDRVMLVCDNCRPFIAIFLALTGMDAWPVLANARLSAREIDDIRDHCGARRVIYMTSVSPQATQHAKRHGAIIGEQAGLGPIGFGPLNEKVEPEPIDRDSAHRVAALIYTSGTTGLSVVLLGSLLSGATLYLAPRFDPVAALAALERDRLTIVLGVPAMFALLVDYAKTKGLRGPLTFPALRIISSSG